MSGSGDNRKVCGVPLRALSPKRLVTFRNCVSLSTNIGSLNALTSLEFSNGAQLTFPTEIGLLRGLKKLVVTSADQVVLPTEIGLLERLTRLEVSDVPVFSFPQDKLADLDRLVILGLRTCGLTSLPSSLYELHRLQFLSLAGNEITDLAANSDSLGSASFRSLKSLDVSFNKLTVLNPTFAQRTPLLEKLMLSWNSLETFPELVPDVSGDWDRLLELKLASNSIRSFPETILGLGRLQVLDLHDNEMARIPTGINQLSQLREMNFEGNDLTFVPSTLNSLSQLRELKLGQLVCDCTLLSWYTDLFDGRSRINNPFATAQCSDTNEYAENYPHLLKSDTNSPCSSPILSASGTETNITQSDVYWTLPMKTEADRVMKGNGSPRFTPDMEVNFEICARATYFGPPGRFSEDVYYLAFAVTVKGLEGDYYMRSCYLAEKLYARNDENGNPIYHKVFTSLDASTTYEVEVRPLRLEFVVLPGQVSTSFSYGIAGAPLLVTTKDFPPSVSTLKIELDSGGARELTVSWEPFERLGDRVVEYEVELSNDDLALRFTQSTIRRTATLRGLETELDPDTPYRVRVRGKTFNPAYGPWSTPFTFSTCPLNMASDKTGGPDCYSLIGYYTIDGTAVSCTTIPGLFLKEGGCDVAGIDVQNIPMAEGSWRPSVTSVEIKKCPQESYCGHSFDLAGPDQYCTKNHKGVFCSECLDGFALANNGCVPCDATNLLEADTAMTLGSLVFVVALLLLFLRNIIAAGICSCRPDPYRVLEKKRSRLPTDDPETELQENQEFENEIDDFSIERQQQKKKKFDPSEYKLGMKDKVVFAYYNMASKLQRPQRQRKNRNRNEEVMPPMDDSDDSQIEREQRTKKSYDPSDFNQGYLNSMLDACSSLTSLFSQIAGEMLGSKKYSDEPGATSLAVKLQIVFAFNQVMFAYGRIVTSTPIPTSVASVVGFFTYIDFGAFFAEFKFRCIYNFNHYDDLMLRTVSPIALILALYLLKSFVSLFYPGFKVPLQRSFVSLFLFILFLIYPSTSQVIFETFWCEEFDAFRPNTTEKVRALKTDFRLSCHDREGWTTYAGVMIAIYPVGIVLVYSYYLYSFKWLVQLPDKTAEEKQQLTKVAFLVEPYRMETFWFEAYELIRKLLQTSVVGVFQDSPRLMGFLASCTSSLTVGIFVFFRPYKRDSDNLFGLVSLLILTGGIQYSNDLKYQEGGSFVEPLMTIIYVELVAFGAFVLFDLGHYLLSPTWKGRKFGTTVRAINTKTSVRVTI